MTRAAHNALRLAAIAGLALAAAGAWAQGSPLGVVAQTNGNTTT